MFLSERKTVQQTVVDQCWERSTYLLKKGACKDFEAHTLEIVCLQLFSYDSQSSDESRLRDPSISITTGDNLNTCKLLEIRVGLSLPHLLTSNRQGEEVLAVLLLVADLNSGPLANLRHLTAFH